MLKKHPHILFLVLLMVVFSIGYFYFFQVSPAFVAKPQLEKPSLIIQTNPLDNTQEKEAIGSKHILFLLNEIGAYKLHKDIFTGESPIIEISITDNAKEYFFSVENNVIVEVPDSKADIKISLSSETISDIFNEKSTINEATKKGMLSLEIYSDESTLALKGYKAIYDILNEEPNKITGDVVLKMYPLGVLNLINISLLVVFSIIVGLVIEKEL